GVVRADLLRLDEVVDGVVLEGAHHQPAARELYFRGVVRVVHRDHDESVADQVLDESGVQTPVGGTAGGVEDDGVRAVPVIRGRAGVSDGRRQRDGGRY